jgi:hypothetical protein
MKALIGEVILKRLLSPQFPASLSNLFPCILCFVAIVE